MQTGKGAAAEVDTANRAERLIVGDVDEMAGSAPLDGHFGNDGYAHACSNHADKAAELSAFEGDLRMKAGAVAGRDGRVAEAVAIAEEQEGLGAELLE